MTARAGSARVRRSSGPPSAVRTTASPRTRTPRSALRELRVGRRALSARRSVTAAPSSLRSRPSRRVSRMLAVASGAMRQRECARAAPSTAFAERWSPDAPIQTSPRLRVALVQRPPPNAWRLMAARAGRCPRGPRCSPGALHPRSPPAVCCGLEANRVYGVRAPRSQPRRTLGPPSFQRRRAGGSGGRRDSRRVRVRCACSPLRSSAR
jgi:hypothetical protein